MTDPRVDPAPGPAPERPEELADEAGVVGAAPPEPPASARAVARPPVPPPWTGSPSRGVEAPPPERVRAAHSAGEHVRAAAVLVLLTLLVVGLAYPTVVTEAAQVLDPYAANGSLLHYPNGTVAGSELIAQNTSAPYLFWERPSPADYNMFNGTPALPGPSDPALVNETLSYMAQYGNFTVNASVPFWLVSASGSSVDPDLTPEAVLVQVPRVSMSTNLTEASLLALVNAHIQNPPIPYLGVAYVNVLELDLALLPLLGR